MRKFLSVIAVITALCSVLQIPAFAADNNPADAERVEISFSVGDDTLKINGNEVKVEKPYVVGEGVTLVPLRVITEAFGATVEWNGEDRSIRLSYPDVDILLQIDNPVAEVNNKAENLLSAPELTEQGYTMVPLRFISETFGASVEWDGDTNSILVVKDIGTKEQSALAKTVTESNIGDSYYKWTMENPKDMYMETRDFDGTYTSFEYDSSNWIYISIEPIYESYDFEKDYTDQKDSLKSYTLVKADKNTSGNIKTMHFQARDKDVFLNMKYFITSDYIIDIVGKFGNNENELKAEGLRIMDTFVCSYTGKDTYDLSNVVSGKRKFEPDDLNFSILIPQDYYMISGDDSPNEFRFAKFSSDDLQSSIYIGLFSKSDAGSASAMAEKDYNHNKSSLNENMYTFVEPSEKNYRTISVVEYSYTSTDGKGYDGFMRDVFFEKGDYVYNVSVRGRGTGSEAEAATDEILNSIEAGEPDAEKLGILMRNDYDTEGTYTAKGSGWTLTLPNSYKEVPSQNDAEIYVDATTSVMISFQKSEEFNNLSDIRTVIKSMENEYSRNKDMAIIKTTATETVGKWSCITLTFKSEDDESIVYGQIYALYNKGHAVIFNAVYPEAAYSAANTESIRGIIASYIEN